MATQQQSPQKTVIPILIIPGFMSSGLEVRESNIKPGWKGERIWINLQSLGFESIYFGDAQRLDNPNSNNNANSNNNNDEDIKAATHRKYKSAWLEHMVLSQQDMKSETPGVQVRAISGLEGVDYLSPGALTNHVSYVFGPVIQALKNAGYSEPLSLQAAPYDWRLPPSHLEHRDSYFTRTMQQVEDLYRQNDNTPVILLCHSLGTKTCHYFLNFARRHHGRGGQEWLDQYIHTYLPVGGPHLGAPKALRSVISGDKMGLDTFLNTEEALSFGRSLGSGPWLFPTTLPEGVPSSVYVRPQGVLEVLIVKPVNANALVEQRTSMHKPDRYQIAAILVEEEGDGSKRIVSTPMSLADEYDRADFSSERLYFAIMGQHTALNHGDMKEPYLQFLLQEPGIGVAKQEQSTERFNPLKCCLKCITCFWICDLVYRILQFFTCILVQGLTLSADVISRAAGGSTTLAQSDRFYLIEDRIWSGQAVTLDLELFHKDDIGRKEGGCCCCFCCWCFQTPVQPRTTKLSLQLTWTPYNMIKSSNHICSRIAQQQQQQQQQASNINKGGATVLTITGKNQTYQEFSGYDILEREGLTPILQVVKDVYDNDASLGPRTISSVDPPRVKRVHAIYGINLPTEVSGIYKRKDTCLSDSRLKNLYKLDVGAQVARHDKDSGYIVRNGVILETKKTKQHVAAGRQVSGDGTVPYWSLQHVRTWQGPCEVSVVELDRAEHRDILADTRFHKALLEYCQTSLLNLDAQPVHRNAPRLTQDSAKTKSSRNTPPTPAIKNQEVVPKDAYQQEDGSVGYSILDGCNPCG
jgi:hypothetical protein